MKKEVSCGAIIFRREKDQIYFLLLKYPNYWGFPKGIKEEKEEEIETAKREVEEETGIKDLKFILGFRRAYQYQFWKAGKRVLKTAIFFLAETKEKNVRISWEHEGYAWLSFEEAIKKLKFEEDKKNLKEAFEIIKKLS